MLVIIDAQQSLEVLFFCCFFLFDVLFFFYLLGPLPPPKRGNNLLHELLGPLHNLCMLIEGVDTRSVEGQGGKGRPMINLFGSVRLLETRYLGILLSFSIYYAA